MHEVSILTATDLSMLEVYCWLYSEWRRAETLNDQIKCAKELRALASEFGLTPSSRVRVGGAAVEPDDPFADLLGKQ